ncbi:MAG TPA: N-acetylglucosamine-6-phosphate deacetylase [Anaerolineae bacterium]|nr:N-acetylglucosamine-6-phosphate deacetylase [Anaerolineae bacterium]
MDNTLVIEHATLYTPDERIENASVLIQDERIIRVGNESETDFPRAAKRIDARRMTLAPGFIDLQLNGAFGDDFTTNPETIWRVAAQLPRYGITAFLPTLVTCPLTHVETARRIVLQDRPATFQGAEPLGLHVEGPFLNPQKKGAHNQKYLRDPDPSLIQDWSPQSGVRLVTLAPELPNALAMVEELATQGIIVSAGHSMATLEEANAGFAAGIRYATHLFNAMPPLDHRAPGIVGAVLSNPEWTTGLIPDGIHVHPSLVKMVWLNKSARGLNLVSDAMAALGMPPGRYRLNDFDVIVSDCDARLPDGTLAGSILPLDQAVRNLISFTRCPLSDALATVTTTPARILNLSHARGRIAPGYIADLVLLDSNLNVGMTIAAGNIVYMS